MPKFGSPASLTYHWRFRVSYVSLNPERCSFMSKSWIFLWPPPLS